MEEKELRELIRVAIGYDPVRMSIRGHPEITYEYRTITDRDGLIDRISAALLAATPKPTTAWIPIDLLFRDRNTGEVRHAPSMLVEVVKHGNEVLFQDAENGTHRMVALEHIENTRTIGEKEDAPTQELCDRCGWALSGHLRSQYGLDCPPGGARPGFRRSDVPEPQGKPCGATPDEYLDHAECYPCELEAGHEGDHTADSPSGGFAWPEPQGEPSEQQKAWAAFDNRDESSTQGEPSDAQVLAALNGFYPHVEISHLSDWSMPNREAMIRALRAAGKES